LKLLDRKLLLVAGKGGVGRTTVAIALAMAAGRTGRRAAVVELYGTDAVGPRFGMAGRSYLPRPIAPNVDTFSLTPYECLDDFGRQKLRVNALVRVLFHNRVFRAFVDAVPGLHDLFQLGKLNHLASTPSAEDPNYDLLVLDAPATGHGLTLLAAAESMQEMVGGGLVADEAQLIRELLHDPARTGIVLTSLPGVLPINESLELVEQLGAHRRLVSAAVINQVRALPLPAAPLDPVADLLRARGANSLAALGEGARATASRQQRAEERLREGLDEAGLTSIPVLSLARVEPREVIASDHEALAQQLLAQLDRAELRALQEDP